MKKSEVYEQVYKNGKLGLPLITNYLPQSSKNYITELCEDNYLSSYYDQENNINYVFLKDSYCVINSDDPNSPHFIKRLLKIEQKNDPPFNFMLNSEKVYEQWLSDTTDQYISWMEENKEELDVMLNLPILNKQLKEDIDNFREEYSEYIKSKDWYINNVVIDKAKEFIKEEILNFKVNEKELNFLSKFNSYISQSNGMGYIQSIFY